MSEEKVGAPSADRVTNPLTPGSVLFVLGLEGLLGSLFDSLPNFLIVGARRGTHVFFRRVRRWLPCLFLSLPLALRFTFGHSLLLFRVVN
jgi:hypothetical protein